jgi:hypothetical protein
MTIVTYPEFLQDQTYAASRLRYQQESLTPNGEGVINGQADYRVSQRGAGANMSVDVAAGAAYVRGDSGTRPGLWHIVNDATINAAIGANASGNPRIDRILLQLNDATDLGSGTDISTITVLAGTPTGGATLDNLSGAGAVPNSALLLADVVVANGAATIVDANIRSRRTFSKPLVPPLVGLTDTDQVPMMPFPGLVVGNSNAVFTTVLNNFQSAALHILPRRIVGATKLRWRYGQAATTAYTGNYIFAIYDASGRLVAATASTAIGGAINTWRVESVSLTATTTFEAGMYYVFFGNALAGGSGNCTTTGVTLGDSAGTNTGPNAPGLALRNTSGGVTLPATNTILGMTDIGAQTTSAAGVTVPSVTLSTT